VEKSDILILAVKPQVVKKVLENVRDLIDAKKLLVSVAAGVPIPGSSTIPVLSANGSWRTSNLSGCLQES